MPRRPARPARPARRRPLPRRLRRAAKRGTTRLAARLAPPLYRLYMRWVWSTSRLVDHGLREQGRLITERGGVVALCWHEEVFAAPWAYEQAGFRAHVLVNRSGPGDIVTAILERCGHSVTRGGSSRRGSRRQPTALLGVMRWLRENPGGAFGTPVDGSAGPRYRLKPGSLLVARECGLPVVLLRVWFRRCLRLPTWDRAALPLPWNEVHTYAEGPYELPDDADDRAGLERARRDLEQRLVALTARSHTDTGQPHPAELPGPAAE